jgi:hypothetical protein
MLDGRDRDVFGRRLSRSVYVERVVDSETGAELVSENSRDLVEGWDGTLETVSAREARRQACGHVWRAGEPLASCESCSRKAGQTVYVCEACSITCGRCGRSLCLRHTKPAPDGNRYCKRCYRKALRQLRSEGRGSITGGSSMLASFLEWW